MRRIDDNTVDRTDSHAGWFFIKTNTLSAQIRIDLVNFSAKSDRFIRAFRIAHIAIDAVIFN